jgi:hypothetical protein
MALDVDFTNVADQNHKPSCYKTTAPAGQGHAGKNRRHALPVGAAGWLRWFPGVVGRLCL